MFILNSRDKFKTESDSEFKKFSQDKTVYRPINIPNEENSAPETIALFYSEQFSVKKLVQLI